MTRFATSALAVIILTGLYLVVTSISVPLDFLAIFDGKRVLQLVLFSTLMTFALVWTPLRISTVAQLDRLSSLSWICLVFFFLIGFMSALRLERPAYALVDVSMIFIMMILIAVVAASRELSAESFDKSAVVLLAAVGLAVGIQEFMGFAAGWVLGIEFSYEQAFMHFAHPRFYNQLQTWSIPVVAALPLIFPGKRWVKLCCISLLGLQWFLVLATAARGTFISLLTAMVFIALWLPRQRRFWLKFQAAGLLVGIALYLGAFSMTQALKSQTYVPQSQPGKFYAQSIGRPMAHTSGRSTFWRLSMEDARKNPILGAGPTRYGCDSEIFSLPAHPHSFPFRILGEWGVIALIVVLILTIKLGLGFLGNLKYQKEVHSKDPPLKAILAISLSAGVMHACLSGLLIMPASQVAMILIAGWNLSLSRNLLQAPQSSALQVVSMITATLLAAVILAFAMKEIAQLPKQDGVDRHYRPAVPRFWQDGRACGTDPTPSVSQ